MLIVYQTYSIAFFYQRGAGDNPTIAEYEIANDLTALSYKGLAFRFGSLPINIYELVIVFVIILIIFNIHKYSKNVTKNFIIKLVFAYCIYQILVIVPLSFFIYSLSLDTLARNLIVRLNVLLIPFLFYFTFPALKKYKSAIFIINISSLILVLAGIINYFTGNVFVTNTSQLRLLWGGAVLIFALTFIDSFFSKKKTYISYVFLIVGVFGILITNHRSAFVYIVLVFMIGMLMTKNGNKDMIISLAILAFSMVLISELDLFGISFLKRFESTSMNDDNAQGRLLNWGLAFKYFLQHPINGSMYTNQYYSTEFKNLYPPHNFIFETLSTQGIVGLSFYLTLILKSLGIAYKNRKDETSLKMFLVLFFYVLYSTFNVTFINNWVVLIMMFSIALILYRDKQINIIKKKLLIRNENTLSS
jgi:O-antigen ligase